MVMPTDTTNSLALDARGMNALKQSAHQKSPEALKAAATQFEAMFLNMIMKSMREASPQDGPMDSQETKTYTTMLDQQLSQTLAKRGVGLADMMIKQMTIHGLGGTTAGGTDAAAAANGPASALDALNEAAVAAGGLVPKLGDAGLGGLRGVNPDAMQGQKNALDGPRPVSGKAAHIQAFQDKLGADAEAASRATGIPAKFMLGQAALESGWGKREIIARNGTPSHNLFGIKAGPSWKGKVVSAVTTEYVNGVPQTRVEKFRAYSSYSEAFNDYAKLLKSNPRYDSVIANAQDAASFARGLQRAGYATDPHYAAKLSRIINHSLA